jgi:hypothetical protein
MEATEPAWIGLVVRSTNAIPSISTRVRMGHLHEVHLHGSTDGDGILFRHRAARWCGSLLLERLELQWNQGPDTVREWVENGVLQSGAGAGSA